MTEVTTIGLDLAKRVFQVHGADTQGRPVLRKKLRRAKLMPFFADLPPGDQSVLEAERVVGAVQ